MFHASAGANKKQIVYFAVAEDLAKEDSNTTDK